MENNRRIYTVCSGGLPIPLATDWLLEVDYASSSPRTHQQYATQLAVLFRWLEACGRRLFDLTYSDLKEFRRALENNYDDEHYLFKKEVVSDDTRYQTMSCALRFIEWCTKQTGDESIFKTKTKTKPWRRLSHGMLHGIVGMDIKAVKSGLLRRKKTVLPGSALTSEEMSVIWKWINQRWANRNDLRIRNKAIIELFFDGALRKGELLSVRLTDLDLDMGLIRIPYLEEEYEKAWTTGRSDALQKTGERIVVIGPNTVQLLNQYIVLYRPKEAIQYGHQRLFCIHAPAKRRGQALTKDALAYIFQVMNRPLMQGGCGVKTRVHAHIFRHTWSTMAAEDGVDLAVRQAQLGHKNPETTALYEHLSPEYRKKHLNEWRMHHPERYE